MTLNSPSLVALVCSFGKYKNIQQPGFAGDTILPLQPTVSQPSYFDSKIGTTWFSFLQLANTLYFWMYSMPNKDRKVGMGAAGEICINPVLIVVYKYSTSASTSWGDVNQYDLSFNHGLKMTKTVILFIGSPDQQARPYGMFKIRMGYFAIFQQFHRPV